MYESAVYSGFTLLLAFYASVASPDGWIRIQLLSVAILCALQLVGTIIADDCSHPLNAPVTYSSFLLVVLQPWMFNEWQWALAHYRGKPFTEEHKKLVRVFALVFAVGMLLRSSPCTSSMCTYCARGEPFCSPTGAPACVFRGTLHIYWRMPLRPANYLFPGFWAHFTLCFLPTFVVGATYERGQNIMLLLFGIILPFSLAYLTDRDVAFDELPALWSLALAPLHAVCFVFASKNKIPTKRNKKKDLLSALDPNVIDPDEYNRLREKLEKQIEEEEDDGEEEEEGGEEELYENEDDEEDDEGRLSFDDISSGDESETSEHSEDNASFITSSEGTGDLPNIRRRKKL